MEEGKGAKGKRGPQGQEEEQVERIETEQVAVASCGNPKRMWGFQNGISPSSAPAP